ncbi:sensor histidine kinase [Gulosibacter molinativorax]|uniref:histidine kinase n=1 Tax=Gulosibacter molinativorax TaxID=256821 RepID=A0ABT7C789_9MICO|nr:histidine kinase [Gulosibacter molinativorax]MDJ1371032.1 two-component sensor histidine kinase [Gulosibacter molinativorax]
MHESFIATHERPMRVLLLDGVTGGVLLALSLLGAVGGNVFASIAFVPAVLLFAIRRSSPITFLWLATVLAGTSYAMGLRFELFVYLIVLVGTYGVAAFAPRRLRLVAFVPLVLALLMTVLDGWLGLFPSAGNNFFYMAELRPEERLNSLLSLAVVSTIAFVAAWALGMLRRSQLMDVVRQRERADLLERDAHRLAQLAVTEERTRISREMHDIIAHSLASVLTLAEGGRMRTKGPGDETSYALFNEISGAARTALGDVKVLLHQVDGAQTEAPAYGVADIPDLAESAKLAGLPLEYAEEGEPRELPSGQSLALYRVAQESITNILKHAPGQRAELTLSWGERGVSLVARNSLPSSTGPVSSGTVGSGTVGSGTLSLASESGTTSGRGLFGMRERAELFDGDLTVRQTDHLFEVRAEWPYA